MTLVLRALRGVINKMTQHNTTQHNTLNSEEQPGVLEEDCCVCCVLDYVLLRLEENDKVIFSDMVKDVFQWAIKQHQNTTHQLTQHTQHSHCFQCCCCVVLCCVVFIC